MDLMLRVLPEGGSRGFVEAHVADWLAGLDGGFEVYHRVELVGYDAVAADHLALAGIFHADPEG
ncbi:hypothetical protein D3C78_1323760 [compost metagenome]